MMMTAIVLSRFSVATRNIGGYVDSRSVLSMEYASGLDGAHGDQNLGNGAFKIYTNERLGKIWCELYIFDDIVKANRYF